MKFHFNRGRAGQVNGAAAYSLLECLVYLSVFALVASLALAAYYRVEQHARGLDASDSAIRRALQAGERWRADVRAAVAPLRWETNRAEPRLVIPQARGQVEYVQRGEVLWRTEPGTGSHSILAGLGYSRFELDQRRHVTAWRWEMAMQKPKHSRRAAQFTFLAVPGKKR